MFIAIITTKLHLLLFKKTTGTNLTQRISISGGSDVAGSCSTVCDLLATPTNVQRHLAIPTRN